MEDIILQHPTIVIGVPAFNEAKHLREALESVRAQTHRDFAVLIADNASSDATAEIAREFVSADDRFHYHRHDENVGALGNFRFLRDATSSPLFMWLGGHDVMEPTFLERTIAAHRADPQIALAYSFIRLIDDRGETIALFGDEGAARLPANPMLRYVQAIRYAYGHQVNHVFRRAAIASFVFESSVVWDLVLLCHAAFHGNFHATPEHLFRFRDLHPQGSENSTNIMERITGRPGEAGDHRRTLEHYLADFDRLSRGLRYHRFYRWLLRSLLVHRLLPGHPGFGAKLLGTGARIKQWVRSVRTRRPARG